MTSSQFSAKGEKEVVVFIFQPPEDFFHSPFNVRLTELGNQIKIAEQYVKSSGKKDAIFLFVAPEYLFKNYAGEGQERYFTRQLKKEFKEKLVELSMFSKMILVPGTICWKKKKKNTNDLYFRNSLYVAFKGKIHKYKKAHPHPDYDYDFGTSSNFFSFGDPKKSIKIINGSNFAFEICYDNVNQQLKQLIGSGQLQQPLDFHIIIGDGVEKPHFMENHANMISIKVERKPEEFHTLVLYHSGVSNLEAVMPNELSDGLSIYKI